MPAPWPSTTSLVSGLGGAIGCDFVSSEQRLYFVEYSGKLSRLDLFPSASVLSSGSTVLHGTWTFDLDAGTEGPTDGTEDIWWEQIDDVNRQMTPKNSATIVNVGAVDFDALSSTALQSLPYDSSPIPGNDDGTNQLGTGDVFAVHTTDGNYAKVKVQTYGYDMVIEWVTFQLDPAYVVLGTGYDQPEDVRVSMDRAHAYVTERSGNLLYVDLANANRADATVIASGMTAPQQLFVDENAGFAYTVEYEASGALVRIELGTGTQTDVLTGLDHPVGVVLSSDALFAYVSEQTSGPDAGRVSKYRLADGTRTALATGLTAPFFLTWTNALEHGLLCTQRDPANSLVLIDAASGGASVVPTGLAFRPSCTAVVNGGLVLVTCDEEIDEVQLAFGGLQPDGPLLEGIGFVPFDWITPGGLADTTGHDPSYFFQVHDAPFGGPLPVMVNFVRAAVDGAAYYQVYADGNLRTDQFHTAKWDGLEYAPFTVATQDVLGVPGFYAVPSVADLALIISPLPGCYLDSTDLADGVLHSIDVAFFDSIGDYLGSASTLQILVDNRPCAVTLDQARIGGTAATTDCGYLPYNPATTATDHLTIDYTATQPGGFATWAFTLTKSQTTISSASGVVPAPGGFDDTVAHVLGTCVVAAFVAQVWAGATATSGWWRCSQYDRSAAEAFALAH